MTHRAKYKLATIITWSSLLVASQGVARLHGELVAGTNRWPGYIQLFGAAIVGCTASIMQRYYKARRNDSEADRIAMEALAAAGEQQQAERSHARQVAATHPPGSPKSRAS